PARTATAPAAATSGATPTLPPAVNTPPAIISPAPATPPAPAPAPAPGVEPVYVPPPPPRQGVVPSGTLVATRMIDSINSETAHVGETFKASLDAPITVDNDTVFPKGSEVYVKVAKVQSAGRVSGASELQVQLDQIFLGKKSYPIQSNLYVNTGEGQGKKTAKSAGLGA